jgi:uncharacterized cysteine cluster protein YcgN (CxxCxxCC family)
MDLHLESGPCDRCGACSLFLWMDSDGGRVCQSCLAALVKLSDREIANREFARRVTAACLGLGLAIAFWCWLAGMLGVQ